MYAFDCGRARWKIENENNNTLKTAGYHLEHNFGHGKQYLASLLATMNILAFLFHTMAGTSQQKKRSIPIGTWTLSKRSWENTCLQRLFELRYGNLKKCPFCKKETHFYKRTDKKAYACQWCGYLLSPTANTIFHKSDTKLTSWFFALYLFSTSKNGVAAKELERQIGCTYKTAWRIAKQIRLLFEENKEVLSKIVELDETYVGGKGGNKSKSNN